MTLAPAQGIGLDPGSELPRDVGVTTDTRDAPNRKRTSGCDRCGETGSKSSIAETCSITPRTNGYPSRARRDAQEFELARLRFDYILRKEGFR